MYQPAKALHLHPHRVTPQPSLAPLSRSRRFRVMMGLLQPSRGDILMTRLHLVLLQKLLQQEQQLGLVRWIQATTSPVAQAIFAQMKALGQASLLLVESVITAALT